MPPIFVRMGVLILSGLGSFVGVLIFNFWNYQNFSGWWLADRPSVITLIY